MNETWLSSLSLHLQDPVPSRATDKRVPELLLFPASLSAPSTGWTRLSTESFQLCTNSQLTKEKKHNSSLPQARDGTYLIMIKAAFPLEFSTAKAPQPHARQRERGLAAVMSVICDLHARAALTLSAGITGLVKSTQVGLQGSKPNHIRVFLRFSNTSSPRPPQLNTNSSAARAVGFGV